MYIPDYYEFENPVKIISGKKALENLAFELERLNVTKPIILTDQGIKKAGLLNHVLKALADTKINIAQIYDAIPADSPIHIVNEIAKMYLATKAEAIIAIGGGSVIDTAKGVNIVVSNNDFQLENFMGAGILKKPLKPFIVIPTTSGTGSEVTTAAVIKDEKKNIKMAFSSKFLLPNIAILDPKMTLTLPPYVTAFTTMDAITHAIESYTCIQKNPMSDAYAWKAVQILCQNVIDIIKNPKDEKKRILLANGATMAGIAFSNSMVGAVHTMGHATGAVAGIAHGIAMNIFLPYILEYNFEHIQEFLAELLLPIAGEEIYLKTKKEERAKEAIKQIRLLQDQLYELVQLPRTLDEAGVKDELFEEIAKKAINDGSITLNPKEVTYEDALKLLKLAQKR